MQIRKDDIDVTVDVSKKLKAIPGDTSTVRVEVEDGIAYLDGVVSNPKLRQEVEDTTRSTDGVGQVVNSIVIEHILNLSSFGYVPIHPS